LPLAVAVLSVPYADHGSKLSAFFFSERWLAAGGPCLGLTNPACFVALPKLSTQIAIIAGFTTSSITELLGIEEHAPLNFSERWLAAGGPCFGLANPACFVA